MIAIRMPGAILSIPDSAFNCLSGFAQFQSTEPRPNSGPSQPDRNGDDRHYENNFDECETTTAFHDLKDVGWIKKDETIKKDFAIIATYGETDSEDPARQATATTDE